MAIGVSIHLSKSNPNGVWLRWVKISLLMFGAIGSANFLLLISRFSADPFQAFSYANVLAGALAVTIAEILVIYLPITVFGALRGRFKRTKHPIDVVHVSKLLTVEDAFSSVQTPDSERAHGHLGYSRSLQAQLDAIKNVQSKGTDEYVRCRECFERFAGSVCPNCLTPRQ
ncbi:MAG: hypothetical protein RLZZ399_2595 [Verrucomicrobiota bacterium]